MTASDVSVTPLVPPGKIKCFITGQLRRDTPEENVRQRWARSLVDEYGYSKTDIGVEVSISMGRARKSCDLVIYRAATPHVQENIVTIVEAKREGIKPSDVDSGVEQLKSYMAACSSCKFGLWVGQERQAYSRNVSDGSISSVEAVSKIER